MPTPKYCALTFDDGPSNVTPFILDLLKYYNCTASFFVIGDRIKTDEQKEIMKRAIAQGCTIENHSFTHSRLVDMSDEEIKNEFEATQQIIYDITGEYPKFFRAPGLNDKGRLHDVIPLPFAGGSGGSADWNSRPEDEATSGIMERINGILNVACDGHIILLHDCGNNYLTPAALSCALPKLIAEGYEFVNIRKLFEIKGIDPKSMTGGQWKDVVKA